MNEAPETNKRCAGARHEAPETNKRSVGARYETLAANYLTRHGVRILAKNFRTRKGEIDLVARDGDCLVFVEVKYRADGKAGTGADAVHLRKQKTICRIADYYLTRYAMKDSTAVRFDVVECLAGADGNVSLNWYRNAFPYHPQNTY